MFRVIPTHPRYFATPEGRVFSFARGKLRQLKAGKSRGYRHVSLYKNGIPTIRKVHHLVAELFLTSPPVSGLMVRHLDDNSENNDVLNLAWGTAQQNIDDRERNGKTVRGENVPRSKLRAPDVMLIRASVSSKASLARRFGVSETQITRIQKRLLWRHVP